MRICGSQYSGNKKEKMDDDQATTSDGRSSVYDSIFTYNTERQFRTNYTYANPTADYSGSTYGNDYGSEVEDQNNRDGGDVDTAKPNQQCQLVSNVVELLFVGLSLIFITLTLPFSLLFSLKFVSSFERLVVMRLGKAKKLSGPGTVLVLPCIDNATKVDIRVSNFVIPPLQVITADKGLVELSVVVFAQVVDPIIAHCRLRDKDQTIRCLAYNTIYTQLARQMLYEVTNPTNLGRLLTTCQEQLNHFTTSKGVHVTRITVTQLQVVKEGENQAVALFNTLMKSQVGTQLMGQLAPHLKEFVAQQNAEVGTAPTTAMAPMMEGGGMVDPMMGIETREATALPNGVLPTHPPPRRDAELEDLISRVRSLCDEQLASKVGKYYRVRCVDESSPGGNHAEIDLDLRRIEAGGKRWCGWSDPAMLPSAIDVTLSLRKDTLMALMDGSLSPLAAYINGQVAIEGAVADAMALKFLAERAKDEAKAWIV